MARDVRPHTSKRKPLKIQKALKNKKNKDTITTSKALKLPLSLPKRRGPNVVARKKAPAPTVTLSQLSKIRERLHQSESPATQPGSVPIPLSIARLGRSTPGLPTRERTPQRALAGTIAHSLPTAKPALPKPRNQPPQPPMTQCQQMTQASAPSAQQDHTWANWGIIDLNTTTGGKLFTPTLFQPKNPYEISFAIQQAEAAGETIRALGSGWSFSDAVLPQPAAIPSSEVGTIEILQWAGFIYPDAWNQFGYAVDTSGFTSSLQVNLAGILLPSVDAGSLFFVEAGIALSELNTLLDLQSPRLALKTMGGSAGQTLAGAISTGTHGGDFDRPPLADSVHAIYLIGAGGIHHWIERSAAITDPNQINATYPCIAVDNCHYDDNLFNAVLVSMGCMGVIYALVLDVVPQYALVQFNYWSTWEFINGGSTGGVGLYRLFTGALWGINEFLNQIGWTGNSRFLQIVINPIMNSDGTHSCYISTRYELPLQLQEFPPGIQIPSGVQPMNLSTLTPAQLQSQAQTAILSQPECGLWQTIAFSQANISGNTTLEVAQSLINFCKSYNYFWAVRAVIDLIFQANFPQSPLAPQIDLGYKVMAGGGVFSDSLKGDIASAEVMFPFSSTDAPDAIGFINSMLSVFDQGIPQNVFPAGYLSLRPCGPTEALLVWSNLARLAH